MRSDPQLDAKLELLGAIMQAARAANLDEKPDDSRIMLKLSSRGQQLGYLFISGRFIRELLEDHS